MILNELSMMTGSNWFSVYGTRGKLQAVEVYGFVNDLFKRFKTDYQPAKAKKDIFARSIPKPKPITYEKNFTINRDAVAGYRGRFRSGSNYSKH
ncbi:MAG: hypothetical protein ACOYW3_11020 [Bacteroidota bacterium]